MGNCLQSPTSDDISLLRGSDGNPDTNDASDLDSPPPYNQEQVFSLVNLLIAQLENAKFFIENSSFQTRNPSRRHPTEVRRAPSDPQTVPPQRLCYPIHHIPAPHALVITITETTRAGTKRRFSVIPVSIKFLFHERKVTVV